MGSLFFLFFLSSCLDDEEQSMMKENEGIGRRGERKSLCGSELDEKEDEAEDEEEDEEIYRKRKR